MRIHLDNNCQEDWDAMSPAEGGRHCDQCNKTVIDFSNLTHQEIAAKLASSATLCGRFSNVQLDPDVIKPIELNPRKGLFTWLSGLILLFGFKELPATGQPAPTEQGVSKPASGGISFTIPEIEKDSICAEAPKADLSKRKKEKGVAFRTKRNTFYWCRRFPFIRRGRCYQGVIFAGHESVRLLN